MAEQLRMPALSQSMLKGRIVEWLKQEGDRVTKGEPLVSVESDKATSELQAPQSGVLRRIVAAAGDEADVDAPLAIIAQLDEDISALVGVSAAALPPLAKATALASGAQTAAGRRPISPAARRLARETGVDICQVRGTGEDGLVTAKDVRAFVDRATNAPIAAAAAYAQVIPLTGLRGRIAERMSLSRRTAADVTTVVDVDMGLVAGLRKKTGYSYTAYAAWAAAQALREFPLLNAWLTEDRILVKREVHLGVAVATDGALVVPVLRHADRKGVGEIDSEIDLLAAKARAGQLTPDDLKGSTFTVTNSGTFGSLLFTPIINLPEVAILGLGKVADTPVVREGRVLAGMVMYLCLSYDHRAVDGALAVQFLRGIKRRLEDPQ